MNQAKDNKGFSQDLLVRAGRGSRIVLIGIFIVSILELALSHAAYAEPLVKVLFGSDSCTFLPERPAPSWINKRPHTQDYVGISNANRMASSTEQIQAAEQNARGALAAEIEVVVQEVVKVVMGEKNRMSATAIDRESSIGVDLEAKSTVNQTLLGSRIEERWLDRDNCIVHVMATASQASVEEAKKKLAERLRKLFKFKNLMLLDGSDVQGEMTIAMRGYLEALFKEMGNRLLSADTSHRGCAEDPGQPACQEPLDTIYASYKVVLDKEALSTDGQFKGRYYKVVGNVRLKDRLIASFDVACQGKGKASQDFLIDHQAADQCFKKAKLIIEKGMEGSE